jgi:transcriptional regulator with XRE-family HTH domain
MGQNEVLYKKLGIRIKELRKKYNLSQSQLGAQSNLEKTAIQRIERGYNSTLYTLSRLAEGFDISLSELLDIDNKFIVTEQRAYKYSIWRKRFLSQKPRIKGQARLRPQSSFPERYYDSKNFPVVKIMKVKNAKKSVTHKKDLKNPRF